MNKLLQIMTATLTLTTAVALTDCTNQPKQQIGKNNITLSSDRLTPEALWAMGRIGSYVVSPDTKQIAYTVSYYSVQENKSHTVIYIMNADGTDVELLTKDNQNETDPAFTPDGKNLAYLSNKGGTNQVWLMNTDGTNRRQLTNCSTDVEGFKISPDGNKIILVRSIPSYTSIEKNPDDLPLATGMVINDLNYKHWDHYVTSIPHIFLSQINNRQADDGIDILADQPYECPTQPFGGIEEFNWSPDNKHIVYVCRKKTGRDYAVSTDTDIYCYDIETNTTVNLCKPADYIEPQIDPVHSMADQPINKQPQDYNVGYDLCPAHSPNGRYIAWLSMKRCGYESDRTRLCVLDLETNTKTYLTENLETGVDGFCWDSDSRTIYFTAVWHARSSVYKTDLQGNVTMIAGGDFDYNSNIQLCGTDLILTRHSLSTPDDIFSITTQDQKHQITQLTHENDHILSQLTFGQVRQRMVTTTDGCQELCWVVYPPHFDPTKKYPTLLFCEGGPQSPVSQFWSYRWNFQIMAANDYIIIAPNRRGLPGFGMQWLEEISGDYAGQCMNDYLSAIDDLCNEAYVDKERLGCVGASFGGYSVYYLAGHHQQRFKCFIAHDGIFNAQNQYYETEEMWFPNWDNGGAPWDPNVTGNTYLQSPHLYIDKWDTPILCIHGEKDYRILSSQGQSAFTAAVMRGIPAQLLLYPDENHWVLKPQNGILWQRTFFRWLDRWLKN